jgi:hypothetical protein
LEIFDFSRNFAALIIGNERFNAGRSCFSVSRAVIFPGPEIVLYSQFFSLQGNCMRRGQTLFKEKNLEQRKESVPWAVQREMTLWWQKNVR